MKLINLIRNGLLPTLVIYSSALLAASYRPISTGKAQVISTDGLVLRSGPGKDQKRLEVLPFGAKVEVLESAQPKMDSLPAIFGNNFSSSTEEPNWIRRVGYWVKVRWNGKIGYALDIFLAEEDFVAQQGIRQQSLPADINNSFLLFQVGTSCTSNIPPAAKYHWSGVYLRSNVVQIKPVTLRQHVTRMDAVVEGQLFLHTFSDDNVGLKYLIGSLETFGASRQSNLIYGRELDLEQSPEQLATFLAGHGIFFIELRDELGAKNGQVIKIKDGNGLEQVLDWGALHLYPEPWLNLVADLDGDGKQDYIVTYGEASSRTVLFLSSKPHLGKIVCPWAVWFSTYCC